MKKVLIWDTFPLENIGGPMGYLFNLHEYLKIYPTEQITFLSDIIKENEGKDAEWYNKEMYTAASPFQEFQIINRLYMVYQKCIEPFNYPSYNIPCEIDVDQYDFVHVHMVPHVCQFRKLYPRYRGKVILTTHCPCTWTDEILSYVASPKSKLSKIIKYIRPFVLNRECKVYKTVDYLMFPCEGAKEPYQKDPKISALFTQMEGKFFYVPSSLPDYNVDTSAQQKISEFGIPKDAFVIAYFGRHTAIKGYDILCQVGLSLLDEFKKLYILCAGRGDILPPQHPRWIELGFINNVDDLIPQCDLYILPNRETYFDLIALQVLRAGIPMVLTDTGGNKYLKSLPKSNAMGLFFFDVNNIVKLREQVKLLISIHKNSNNDYNKMKQVNRTLYEDFFTIDKYVNNYLYKISALNS